jgi:hypothetical protein
MATGAVDFDDHGGKTLMNGSNFDIGDEDRRRISYALAMRQETPANFIGYCHSLKRAASLLWSMLVIGHRRPA